MSRIQIECDNEGFLIGTPVDLGDVVDSLSRVADDVRAIRAAMAPSMSSGDRRDDGAPAPMPIAPIVQVIAPASQPSIAPSVDVQVDVQVATPNQRPPSNQDQNSTSTENIETRTASPRQREANGRFTGGGAPGEAEAERQRTDRRFNDLGDRVVNAVGEPPEVDPFIAAYNEIARPVGRVMKSLAGDEKKQETWLKKIWRALTDPNAQRNQGGQQQQGGGLLDGLMGLLGLGGRGGRGAPRIPPAAGAGAAGLLGSLGRGLAGFAKKLPLIGGLIAGALTAGAVMDSEADETTTRREKDENAGKLVGGLGGMIAGGFAGAKIGALAGAIGGPIGVAIGGVVGGVAGMFFGDQAGQIIGETIGGWVNDLRTADIPGMIANAWNGFIGAITGTWDAAMYNIGETFTNMAAGVMSMFDGLKNAVTGAIDTVKNGAKVLTEGVAAIADKAKAAFKDITGVDLDAVAKNVTDAASAGVDAVKTGIVNVADKANTAVRDATGVDAAAKAKEAWETLQEGANTLKEKAEGMVTGAVEGAKTVVNNGVEAAKKGVTQAVDATKKGAAAMGDYVVNDTTPGKLGKKLAEVATDTYKGVTGEFDSVSGAIHKGESKRRGYDDYNRGSDNRAASNKANLDLQNMTLAEVMEKQALPVGDKDRLFAAGKYQVIPETMKAAVQSLGLDPSAKFSADTQEKIFAEYLMTEKGGRKDIEGYVKGKHDDVAKAMLDTGKLYAAVGVDGKKGYYDGVGNNKASISSGEMNEQYVKARAKYAEMIASGADEKTAYAAALGIKTQAKPSGYSQLPPSVATLPVKGSDGTTRTLDDMGVKSWDDLQGKGGQAFAGGQNDPATLYATSLIKQGLGDNFDRLTGQNDAFHQSKKPGSEHTKGNKTDFTIKGVDSETAAQKVHETMQAQGLEAGKDYKLLDEYKKLSPGGEGGHFDFNLTKAGQEKMSAKMQAEQVKLAEAKAKDDAAKANAPKPAPLAFKPQETAPSATQAQNDKAQTMQSSAVQNTQVNAAPTAAPPVVSAMPPAVTASMPPSLGMIKAPAPIPAVSDSPIVPEPIGMGSTTASSGRSENYGETLPVGQDVRDRRIAHVVTGGLSNLV